MGAWDEALPPADEFVAACEAGSTHYHEARHSHVPGVYPPRP